MKAGTCLVQILACVLGAILLLSHVTETEADNMAGPPVRPEVFRNPQELRDYLTALNEYFAIVGRPRYVCPCLEYQRQPSVSTCLGMGTKVPLLPRSKLFSPGCVARENLTPFLM